MAVGEHTLVALLSVVRSLQKAAANPPTKPAAADITDLGIVKLNANGYLQLPKTRKAQTISCCESVTTTWVTVSVSLDE